jgi:tetratricopeptide (TPR) repeat protein
MIIALIGAGSGLWATARSSSTALVARGLAAYSRGEWAQAADLARSRLKQAPGDTVALNLVARATARLDRDQAAIAVYSQLELERMTGEDYFLLGRAVARTGRDDLALKSLESARATDPDRLEMLDELARVYFRNDRPAAAEEIALRLARHPAWEARAQLILGTSRAVRNDPAGAARALARALLLDPDLQAAAPQPQRPLRLLLVRSLLRCARPAPARSILETEPTIGSDPEIAWLMSRTFLQERAWDRAAAALDRAGRYHDEYPLEPEPAPFTGEARCAPCHRAIVQSVLASRHATTFTRPRIPRDLSFPDQSIADPADPKVSHEFAASKAGIRVETRVGDGVFRALARYAFGSPDTYVTLVGPDDKGQPRMLRISSYHSPRGSGLDITSGVPPQPSEPVGFLGNPLIPGDGERRCLACHTTNLHAIEVESGPEAADHAIGCEACHGPGGNHIIAQEGGFSDQAIIVTSRSTPRTINQVCERCHGLAHVDTVSGPDDDPAWLRFQTTTMYRSRCYTAGAQDLHCVTCHDPHTNAQTTPAYYVAKCSICHGPNGGKTTCPVNKVEGCIDCHMPKIWVAPNHTFRTDHNIRARTKPIASSR